MYLLREAGHSVQFLRDVLEITASDAEVLNYANEHELLVVTCNRDDFLELARSMPHYGIVILIRRRTRLAERAALFHLLQAAGENGLIRNINFA